MLETPWSVKPVREEGGVKVEFRGLMELCQGCPEVGQLIVNGRDVSPKNRFGGPVLIVGQTVFAPVYHKSFFKTGFKIAKIDAITGEVFLYDSLFQVIDLIEIAGNELRFYTDMNRAQVGVIKLA